VRQQPEMCVIDYLLNQANSIKNGSKPANCMYSTRLVHESPVHLGYCECPGPRGLNGFTFILKGYMAGNIFLPIVFHLSRSYISTST